VGFPAFIFLQTLVSVETQKYGLIYFGGSIFDSLNFFGASRNRLAGCD